VDFSGRISSLSGGCPAVTFRTDRWLVVTDAGTEFRKSSCSELVNGANVDGRGRMQANGAVLAERIEVKDHHN
jgi:hypothetical protein